MKDFKKILIESKKSYYELKIEMKKEYHSVVLWGFILTVVQQTRVTVSDISMTLNNLQKSEEKLLSYIDKEATQIWLNKESKEMEEQFTIFKLKIEKIKTIDYSQDWDDYKEGNMTVIYFYDQGGLPWEECKSFTDRMNSRLPTKQEVLDWLQDKERVIIDQDQWIATEPKNWIQIGNSIHLPGTDHSEKFGYPEWGDYPKGDPRILNTTNYRKYLLFPTPK